MTRPPDQPEPEPTSLCDPASAERASIEVLEPYLEPRRYHAGQVLWTEGESSGRLIVLEHGRVKIVRVQPDGRSMLLYVFSPGDLFGFLPFVDGRPYPATAIALDDLEARVMSRSTLRTAIARDPQVALTLLAALGSRLRQAFERIGDHARRSATAQVAASLLLLQPPAPNAPAAIIEVPRPTYAFAEDLGLTPETFSRAVTQLVDAEVLHRLGAQRLQVLDQRRLEDVAAGRPLAPRGQ